MSKLARLTSALGSADVVEVCEALEELRRDRSLAGTCIGAVEPLLLDTRVRSETTPSGPIRTAVCEAAVEALVAAGPGALDALTRAATSTHTVELPEPCYDQGVYIGDYATRTILLRAEAEAAIRRIGRDHRGSVAWIGMTPERWLESSDPMAMLKACAEHAPIAVPKLRSFLCACCRRSAAAEDAGEELELALATAERAADAPIWHEALIAARAAARDAARVGAHDPRRAAVAEAVAVTLGLTLGLPEAERALALLDRSGKAAGEDRVRADLLRELFPERSPSGRAPPPRPPVRQARRAPWDDLIEDVLANLDDDAPRLVYADWLIERGDPRGELITVECEIARTDPGEHARLALMGARERDLLHAHASEWTPCPGTATFRRGFVESAFELAGPVGPHGGSVLRALREEPTLRALKVRGHAGVSWLDCLAEMPEARRLQQLTLTGGHYYAFELERLFASPHLENLVELELSHCSLDDDAVRVLGAGAALRHVRTLILSGNGLGDEARRVLEGSPSLTSLEEVVL